MSRRDQVKVGKTGFVLIVRVTPRARKNEITGILGDGMVKVRLTAPPVEGKANEALIRFLARVLDVSTTKIEIVGGVTGRDKLVSLIGLDAETAQRRIISYLARE
ncbi:MAG: hypothetical protein A2Z49_10695 [Chloroflexi bacterium RBG_19FT_COMBO_56_12]|nr:MAG: hypothetical protein A2Z49_10695 [Chloroflexi bacterium RBG_19FT_COMBO_56_12]